MSIWKLEVGSWILLSVSPLNICRFGSWIFITVAIEHMSIWKLEVGFFCQSPPLNIYRFGSCKLYFFSPLNICRFGSWKLDIFFQSPLLNICRFGSWKLVLIWADPRCYKSGSCTTMLLTQADLHDGKCSSWLPIGIPSSLHIEKHL